MQSTEDEIIIDDHYFHAIQIAVSIDENQDILLKLQYLGSFWHIGKPSTDRTFT